MFDRETWLFINSFAPWLAALGTVAAVIVSLFLARRASRPDIRVFTNLISLFGQEIPKKVCVQINAVNHSRKAVVNTIAWWSLGFGRREQGWIVLPPDDPRSTKLPCELDFSGEANFLFPFATFQEPWKSLLEHVGESRFPWLTVRLLRVGMVTSTGQYFGAPLNHKMREVVLVCSVSADIRRRGKLDSVEEP